MSETVNAPPTYTQEDIDTAKVIYDLTKRVKKVLVSKKALPFEVEGIIQLVKILNAIPVPQLKIICLALGLILALALVVMYLCKTF